MTFTPHILESALLLLATFLIGCAIGFVLRRFLAKPSRPVSTKAEAPVGAKPQKKVTAASPTKAAPAKKGARPAARKQTPPQSDSAESQAIDAGTEEDDLKKISGIGPKLENELKASGILTYAQIAGWSARTIDEMDAKLNARGRIKRDDWVRQAKALGKAKASV